MPWDPAHPYDDLPPLPPRAEIETHAVLKATVSARARLAQFAALAGTLPNPDILINVTSLLEAQASSEIENIVTTTDELFAAAASTTGASAAAREALRYRVALYAGWESVQARPLTVNTAVSVCAAIRGHEQGVRHDAVYIGDPVTRHRAYTPPEKPEVIQALLGNWEWFVNEPTDLDPLVRMAVAHYQFEAIHPFTDGNGRTGRILNILLLCSEGVLTDPVLYLSQYIIETKEEYYRLLRSVTSDEAWEGWILYVVRSVEATAERGLRLRHAVAGAQERLTAEVSATTGVANHDLVNVLTEQPYARIRDVIARCGVSRPTAAKWLHALADRQALRQVRIGREALFVNLPLMTALHSSGQARGGVGSGVRSPMTRADAEAPPVCE